MKIIAVALAAPLSLAAFAVQAQTAGEPFKENIETRYVDANDKLSIFIGKVYGAAPKVSTTLWIFQRTPIKQGELTFNTAAAVAEIDCAARTLKRTSIMQMHGELFGHDRATRVLSRHSVTEAATAYSGRTIFALAIEQACAAGPVDDKTHPTFQTLSQARTYGFHMSSEAAR